MFVFCVYFPFGHVTAGENVGKLVCFCMLGICPYIYNIDLWYIETCDTCPKQTCCTQLKRKNIKMINNNQKEVQTKLTKGLLDMIVLQLLNEQPMHGYQVITKIRKSFGVYFGPSTVYPLLSLLEKKGQVSSAWNMEGERPKKVYSLTNEGHELLSCTEKSLNLIVKTIGANGASVTANGTEPLSVTASVGTIR